MVWYGDGYNRDEYIYGGGGWNGFGLLSEVQSDENTSSIPWLDIISTKNMNLEKDFYFYFHAVLSRKS